MTETSALDAFIRAEKPAFDMAEYRAALASDWERGRPEQISELDADGTGGIIWTADGHTGYVGCMRYDHTRLTDFRSIRRNENPTWREVMAKDVDGAVWYVGKLKRHNTLPGPSRPWRGD
jgi:hypothetical protein